MSVNEQDYQTNPRLLGKPGVGKTTLAYAAGRRMGRDVYILQATLDTRPEDLLVTPVIAGEGRLRYVASPLVTAMIRGGIAILDEGNRMTEQSWASLATQRTHEFEAIETAIQECLGDEALRYVRRNRPSAS